MIYTSKQQISMAGHWYNALVTGTEYLLLEKFNVIDVLERDFFLEYLPVLFILSFC